MASATNTRNVRTFRSGDYIAGLMAEISKAAVTQRVAAKREESGLTQQEVAELMNVTARTVQYWESQKDPIVAFDRIDELAKVIGTSKFWLLHGADLPGSAEDAASLAEVLRRLESLEGMVEQQGTQVTKSLDGLARDVRKLSRTQAGTDGKATTGT